MEDKQGRPNIIMLFIDDLGYGDTGPFGCKDIPTPNIDRLADEGVVLTQAYVTNPPCCPSRSSLMMGMYGQRFGKYGMSRGILKSKINKLWEKFWSGGISNPLTAIEQMSYLIFMKRLDDLDERRKHLAKMKDEEYISVFEGNEGCRWSEWKHYSAEKMLEHVKDVVFPFIKTLKNGENTLFAKHMKDAIFMIPKASLLQEAVTIIDDMNITAQNQDTQGDIYEYLLSEIKSSGKNGQFRTPRHIIRMMVALVDPDINDKVCDPACGTAGFLINAYEHIVRKYTSPVIIKVDKYGESFNLIGDRITKKGIEQTKMIIIKL